MYSSTIINTAGAAVDVDVRVLPYVRIRTRVDETLIQFLSLLDQEWQLRMEMVAMMATVWPLPRSPICLLCLSSPWLLRPHSTR
jgi:hypothetical protein